MKVINLVRIATFLLATIFVSATVVSEEPAATGDSVKTIAIGNVETGYNFSGVKAYDVKETIQLLLKRELEGIGKGKYSVKIVSPAVVVEGAEVEGASIPNLPDDRMPTQAELAAYLKAMERMQKVGSGEVKLHKPVQADAYVELRVVEGGSEMDTSGLGSTLYQLTGVGSPIPELSTKTAKIMLVCTMRDPASGALVDRYEAKASSVEVRNFAGFTSYNYGDDEGARERLFKNAVKKCAKWISGQVK